MAELFEQQLMIDGREIIRDIPFDEIKRPTLMLEEGPNLFLTMIHPEVALTVSLATGRKPPIKTLGECVVEHQIHNTFFPREDVNNAFFSLALNTNGFSLAKDELAAHQLPVNLFQVRGGALGKVVQGEAVM